MSSRSEDQKKSKSGGHKSQLPWFKSLKPKAPKPSMPPVDAAHGGETLNQTPSSGPSAAVNSDPTTHATAPSSNSTALNRMLEASFLGPSPPSNSSVAIINEVERHVSTSTSHGINEINERAVRYRIQNAMPNLQAGLAPGQAVVGITQRYGNAKINTSRVAGIGDGGQVGCGNVGLREQDFGEAEIITAGGGVGSNNTAPENINHCSN